MGIGVVTDEGVIFAEKEISEGTYVAESAGASAIEVLSDGLELTESVELLERNNRTSTVEKVASRIGQRSMAGSVPTEFKAGSSEGAEPETAVFYEALLGGKRSYTASTSDVGHTTTVINLAATDGLKYAVGDIIKVKEYDLDSANVDHVSPIVDVTGDVLTLLIPYFQAFSDNVEVAAGVTFYHESGAPTLSLTNYIGGVIRQKAIGMRCVSGELAGFSTGQLPTTTFAVEGLNFGREVGAPLFSPAFDTSVPPVTLCAKVFKDSTEIVVNSVTVSMANTLGFLTSTASKNGKISSRITEFTCNFSINPYTEDDNVDNFDLFTDNTPFSLFGSAHNPGSASDNEHLENVAYYIPNARIPELTTGDEDGIATDTINGQGFKNLGNDTVFISFI